VERQRVKSYAELNVYQGAFDLAMRIFEVTKSFPTEEKYSLVDQIRRSSRSVCANIGEAWRKRRYPAHFVSKLSDAETEAEETRVWLQFACKCKYLSKAEADELHDAYDKVLGQLVNMIIKPEQWMV
jgi:four helix bundle protein